MPIIWDHSLDSNNDFHSFSEIPPFRIYLDTISIVFAIGIILANPAEVKALYKKVVLFFELTEKKSEKLIDHQQKNWFATKAFQEIIKRHNRFLSEFNNWRKLFSEHASELASLIKTLPGSENLSREFIYEVIAKSQLHVSEYLEKKIFNPWISHWAGLWSNGILQYHIWDSTYFVNGQWIQPVTLSETEFVEANCIQAMINTHQAGIGINVYSRTGGITGWVSKYQHGRIEIPHVGYLINDTTLIWICQIKEPENLFAVNNIWFIFLERASRSVHPDEYRIFGRQVILNKSGLLSVGEAYFGTYYASEESYEEILNHLTLLE